MIQEITCFKTSKGDICEDRHRAILMEVGIQNEKLRNELYFRIIDLIDNHEARHLKNNLDKLFVWPLATLLELDEEAFLIILKEFTTKTKEVERMLEPHDKKK